MGREVVTCKGLRPIDGPYSYAVMAGGWVFTSAMLPVDVEGHIVGDTPGTADVAAQTEKCLSDTIRVLGELGVGAERIAKVKFYLSDIRHREDCESQYAKTFTEASPAKACVGTFLPITGAAVQLEVTAALDGDVRSVSASASGGVVANGFFFSNGQDPVDENQQLVARGDIRGQVEQALERIGQSLDAAGMEFGDVIKVNGTVPAWYGFSRYSEAYSKYFSEPFPARATVEGKLSTEAALISFEVVAVKSAERITVESTVTGLSHLALKKRDDTVYVPKLPGALGPHSHAVKIGDVIYVCGQIPYEPSGLMVGWGDIRAQTRKTMDNLLLAIEALGGSMDDFVKTNVSITDPQMIPAFFGEYEKYFTTPYPAMTIAGTGLAQDCMVIEIEAIAVTGASRNATVVVDR